MNKLRVLLADDHAIIRDGLRQILADTDDLAVAGEAANGQQLLERLAEGSWDALVLDISMPGRNGLDLLRLIKADWPQLPVLILSMHQEEQYAVRALRAGASGYLTKEADAEVLVAAIRKVATGGTFISPATAELMVRDLWHPASGASHTDLSDREYQVFLRLAAGVGLTEIAAEFSLSVKTVSTHKTRIMQKLNLANTAELVRYALKNHLTEESS